MSKFNFDQGDDLSDFLGTPSQGPRELPQAPEYVRIRAEVPAFEEICRKCGGTGAFRSYSGRPLGNCFACKGKGKKVFATSPQNRAAARQRTVDAKVAVRNDHKAEIAWLTAKLMKADRLPEGYAKLLGDLCSKLNNGQELTEGQLGVIHKGQARDAEWAAKSQQQAQERAVQQHAEVAGIDVANLVDCFQRAREAGLKRFTLRFADVWFEADKHEAGKVWVSKSGYGSDRYGLIIGGVFKPLRNAHSEILTKIALISADPMAAAKAYAQVTSNCSVCGKHLENQDSVDAGIGPVCAGRLNRPGKKFVQVEGF